MTEGRKILTITGITLAVYLGIRFLLPYVIPFFISWCLVKLLNPVINRIRRHLRWKKEILAGFLMILMFAAVVLAGYGLSVVLAGQIRQIAADYDIYYGYCCEILDGCCHMAERTFGIRVDEIERMVYTGMESLSEQMKKTLVPGVVNYSVRYIRKIAESLLFLLILFLSVIFLSRDYEEMKHRLAPYQTYQRIRKIEARLWQQAGMYLKAQGCIILIITVLCTAGLWILGNPYFLLMGIVIGLSDALPFIGTGTVLIPMAIMELPQRHLRTALWYVILFAVTYVVREILEPRMIGSRLGVYPFVMIAAVYSGICLYGPAGVFLGPVTLLLVIEITKEIME